MARNHRALQGRLQRLEHPPPSPREREAERSRRETMERLERQYEELAELRPDAAVEYLEAGRRFREYIEAHENPTNEWGGLSEELAGDPEWRRLGRLAMQAHERLAHGYVSSTPGNCEDCGRGYDERNTTCEVCGGVVSNPGYLYRRIKSIEELRATIESYRRGGYEQQVREYEGILERRLAEQWAH